MRGGTGRISALIAIGIASLLGLAVASECGSRVHPRARRLALRGGHDAQSHIPALSWSGISLTVDGRRILEDISGEARDGRLLGIMGPSGAGKTSLLHVLGGMLQTRTGQV